MLKVSTHRRISRARLLALLLLGTLAWGATAEFTHRHGAQVNARLRLLEATSVSHQPVTPKIEDSSPERQGARSPSSGQCLICQLHQNLSASLFNSPPRIATVDIRVLHKSAAIVCQLSDFASNELGRAPPINL